jgi:hypothetical protein
MGPAPQTFPNPPRPTWRKWHRRYLPLPFGAGRWRVPVLAMVEHAGAHRAGRLEGHAAPSLHAPLGVALCRDGELCSTGEPAFASFAHARGMAQRASHTKLSPRVVVGAFHSQTVNQLHPSLKAFFRPFS